MTVISEQMFRKMMPLAGARLDAHWPFINGALEKGKITTPDRIAGFLAQLAHESKEYLFMQEIWGPTEDQLGYEGRADLGNNQPGDGPKFRGHGPIQITGRANHRACGRYLGIDLEAEPLLLTRPEYGTAGAVWFWTIGNQKIDLNLLADRGWFLTITKIVNGGTNGLIDRLRYWSRNRELLGLPPGDIVQEVVQVKAFQRERGLGVDGAVGPKTLAALRAAA